MYHVVGTAITVSLLYSISFIFYRTGFYSLNLHRKLWNSVLAVTFLFTALAGVFLALQINFKWDIPIIKTILKWHVETGACLALTGIFHFTWHLSYFWKLFSVKETPGGASPVLKVDPQIIGSNLFVVGFTSTSVQLLLMREILNISGGYELITGVFLGSWLIASALGAAIAGRSKLNDIRKINMAFSFSPFVSSALLILLSRLFLESGETPSFLISMVLTFLLLVPFCLVSGFTFIKLISFARTGIGYVPGRSFSIETIGGIVAGILLSVLTSGMLNTWQLIIVILLLSFAYTLLTFYVIDRQKSIISKVIIVLLVSLALISSPDICMRQLLMPGIKVTETKDTPYGNITRAVYGGEHSTYYNQRLLAFSEDVADREENIHYALLQREKPEKVLLISGSLKSSLPELAKYPLEKVIYIERDPALLKNGVLRPDTCPFELSIGIKDAYRYLKRQEESVDAAILLLPPPSTLSLNRFYTTEFFTDIKKKLTPGGVFMCSPGPGDYYLNKESVSLYSSVFNSLAEVFRYIKPVVGNKLYFIASDSVVSVSFCRLTEEREIRNIYVSPDFLADDLIESKSAEVLSVIDPGIRQNSAAFPIACFHYQSYNLSRDPHTKAPSIVLLLLAFALSLLSVRRKNILMYFSASSLAGFEIIMLLTLQLTIGNMYQFTGLIIASLMAGLATGAGFNLKIPASFPLKAIAVLLVLYYVLAALCLNLLLSVTGSFLAIVLIIISVFLPSFITGHIFRVLTISDSDGSSSASVYSADLAGSALGFILLSGVIVPVFGIQFSIFLLAMFIFAGILFGTSMNK